MEHIAELTRSAVRPLITVGVVAAYATASLMQRPEAVDALRELTFIVVSFWFGTRTSEKLASSMNPTAPPEPDPS